ncbi:hypothetical protein JKP88DRAFT_254124 [Tribonema minus]|uniref:Uncharacterized protein n=1 Tax=Tribonema minus TaxID=303371 RepID=A0A835ZBI4_9STRA|nr:hypothetical protein JKP88DRAFT_254124 [Tribonema minus]
MNQQPQPDNVYIDSSQCVRATAYHNDVQVVLPHAIHAADGFSLRICLHSMSIANTQMCVNLYCDTLSISGVSVTLPSGNYSASSLTAALAAAFTTRSVTFNAITSKITFASAATMTISGNMCSILGINEGSSGLQISSAYNVDLSATHTINVFTSLANASLDASANRRRGLLASVQVNVGPLCVLHYLDTTATQGGIIDARSVAEFRLSLFDDAGRPLLASCAFNAMIKFTQVATGVRDLKIERPGSLAAPM